MMEQFSVPLLRENMGMYYKKKYTVKILNIGTYLSEQTL